jgi:hypothetical protein
MSSVRRTISCRSPAVSNSSLKLSELPDDLVVGPTEFFRDPLMLRSAFDHLIHFASEARSHPESLAETAKSYAVFLKEILQLLFLTMVCLDDAESYPAMGVLARLGMCRFQLRGVVAHRSELRLAIAF